ncbi:MAG: hypothetical protein P1V20_22865 [Verrucomicrobiales bacterium]|nr:hypothetical protein [Verrucomicrobiales bacterium]
MKRFFLPAITAFFGVSCQTSMHEIGAKMNEKAGIGAISSSTSKFDGAKELRMSPAMVSRDGGVRASNIHIAAAYTPEMGDLMILELVYQEAIHITDETAPGKFHNITGLDINIDGRKLSFKPINQTKFDNAYVSSNGFAIPITTVRQMIEARDCRIRMTTIHGHETALFHVETAKMGQTFVKLPLRQFIAKIDSL